MPAVSVLMGVHNGEAFLAETLASVAAQDFTDYEFVIVDDASSDGTAAMLAEAAARDPRIRVLTNETNRGLTRSLNRGLEEASGEFIARIDADDICLPNRLSIQHAHMIAHPQEVGIVANFEMIDAEGRVLSRGSEPLDDWQVRWLLGWNPPAPHPTFFFRRCPDGTTPMLYDERFKTAQDFDLWARLAAIGPTRRLADCLIQYRRHEGAITHAKRHEQAQNCAAIGRANLRTRLTGEIVSGLEPLMALFSYNAVATPDVIRKAVAGVDAMVAHDCAAAPTKAHQRWVRRMSAGLLADAILSRGKGLSSPACLAAFMWHARAHLPHLARAVLSDPGTALKSLRNRGR
ncbi:glycosyltransferase [Erythrobacter sp. SCSIO 43205]|uniref:glycosyltransferase family 2 protein n=1 Tax=Erythrobacter sp. SCSIO 43205 TaxID=2779361 RepID=UPI001CA85DB4|nr:glycosyltransferase [Erythrobacter sp. SCSIO 43205]UAB79453.1 glycosyltransferase [Erythrobacter sp. SCSIO 43205]